MRTGQTKSCGCLGKSYGEIKIKKILQENSITFIHDKAYFQDLIGDNGFKLRYDFIVFDENDNVLEIIEFDGIQHFQETNYFHNNLTENKKIDAIKNNYAKQHNYKLLRIPYNRIDDINFQTLFDDTFLFN